MLDDPETVERMRAAPTAIALANRDLLLAGPELPPVRVDPSGMRLPIAPRPATALALSPAGVLLAAADGRLDAFTPDGRPLWSAALPGQPTALVAGADARAVVLAGDRVVVAADHGMVEQTWSLGPGEWTSLAYDAARALVFAGGSIDVDGCGEPVAVARVRATDRTGAPAWETYGEPHTRAAWRRCDALAPTRVVGLALAGDDLLLAAEVERGGGDVFRVLANGAPARLSVIDAASDPDSAGPGAFAYYARLDAGTGTHALGQYLLPPPGAAELRPQAIAADRLGHVYLAGLVRSLPREDDAPPLADGTLAFVHAATPDLSTRPMYWTFAASDDAATVRVRLAIAGDRAVALATDVNGDSAAVRWTTAFDLGNAVDWAGKKEDRPNPDTMELFGYESSASASGDDCFCSSEPRPISAISILGILAVAGLRRRR